MPLIILPFHARFSPGEKSRDFHKTIVPGTCPFILGVSPQPSSLGESVPEPCGLRGLTTRIRVSAEVPPLSPDFSLQSPVSFSSYLLLFPVHPWYRTTDTRFG